MSWFSRAQPQIPAQPQASERDRIRAQQVESLVRANPHAQARNPEKSVFELGLKLADGQIIALRVIMGANFPEEAPTIQLMTNCVHPWISTDGYCRVVGHPELNQWNPRADLGRIGACVACVCVCAFVSPPFLSRSVCVYVCVVRDPRFPTYV
jgi:hypothetical protein